MNEVYSFGEFDGNDQWYALKDGIRIKCDESIINHLWNQWVINPTAKSPRDGHYTIYTVTEPMFLN